MITIQCLNKPKYKTLKSQVEDSYFRCGQNTTNVALARAQESNKIYSVPVPVRK